MQKVTFYCDRCRREIAEEMNCAPQTVANKLKKEGMK